MPSTTAVSLTAPQRLHVLAALGVYREDLGKGAKKAADLGKQNVADAWTAEVRQIQEELVPRIREGAGATDLEGDEVKQCRAAIGRYVKKLRAAAETVGALYEGAMQQELALKADTVEKDTAVVFADQTQLPLEDGEAEADALQRIEGITPGPGGRSKRNKKGRK